MSLLQLRHIKGFNGKLLSAIHAHPTTPGHFFYVCGSVAIAVFDGDPTKQVQLRGHDDIITAVDLSRSGAMLVTGQQGANADVVVWDTKTLTQKFRFQEHDLEVVRVGFSHDERLLATIGNEKERRVFVLDTHTGKIVTNAQLPDHKRTTALTWCPTSGPCYTFATAAESEVILWTVDPFKGWINGEKITPGSVRRGITTLAFSADGQWLFGGTASGDIVTMNVLRRSVQLMHPVCGGSVGATILASNGRLLVGAADGTVSMFDHTVNTHSGRPLATLPEGITSLSVADGGENLLAGTQKGGIFVIATENMEVSCVIQTQQGQLKSMSFAATEPNRVAVSSTEGTVCVWDTQDLTLETRITDTKASGGALSCALGTHFVLSGWGNGHIRCNSRGGGAAAAGATGGQELWVIPNAHNLAHSCGVTAMALSNRQQYVATGGAGGELRVWDLSSREMVSHMKHHKAAITDLKVLIDDTHVLAASEDRTWSIWDVHSEKLKSIFRTVTGPIRGVAMAPDQVSVVSVGLERGIYIWDIRQTTPSRSIKDPHAGEITSVAVSRRGHLIATGGADSFVKLWDFRSGAALGSFEGHTAAVTKLEFSPDDNQLISISDDSSVIMWRLTA